MSLAQGLQLDVIAEGVETAAQRAQMEELGIGFVQGYLLGRPATADVLTGLLARQVDTGLGSPPTSPVRERPGSLRVTLSPGYTCETATR